MQFSNLLTLGAASLAVAAPALEKREQNQFAVTHFSYGCTVGCDWSFDVAIQGSEANHPAINEPVSCSGNLQNTDYVKCGDVSATQTIYAYIEKDTNQLKLQYEVNNLQGAIYHYYGQQQVYASTSAQADQQQAEFLVPETQSTGVA